MSFFSTPNSTNKRCLPDPQPLSNPAKFRNLPGAYTITRPCRAGLRQNQPSVLSPPSSVLRPQSSSLSPQSSSLSPRPFRARHLAGKPAFAPNYFHFCTCVKSVPTPPNPRIHNGLAGVRTPFFDQKIVRTVRRRLFQYRATIAP
jgi:hypothetical protein